MGIYKYRKGKKYQDISSHYYSLIKKILGDLQVNT